MRTSIDYGLRYWVLFFCMVFHAMPGRCADALRPKRQQIRDYEIHVDGSRVGTNRLKISEFDDGRTVVETNADVKISYVVYTYKYQFRGTETWLDGKFQRLESHSEDDGKSSSLSAVAIQTGTQLSVNRGATTKAAAVPLTSNFWYWPRTLRQVPEFTLLEADTGKTSEVDCRLIGIETLQVGDVSVKCRHYRLSGDGEIDLWFDEESRFVCKKCLEEGHPTEVRLTRIKNDATKVVQGKTLRENVRQR